MDVVLAAGFEFEEPVGRTVGTVVAIAVLETPETTVANAQQIATEPVHPLSAALRTVGKLLRLVSNSVAIAVDQNADIPCPGNGHPTKRVDRHRIDVMSQIVVREQRRLEAIRDVNSSLLSSGCWPDVSRESNTQSNQNRRNDWRFPISRALRTGNCLTESENCLHTRNAAECVLP